MGQPEFNEAAIRALASLLHEMDLSEIEIAAGEDRLRVARQVSVAAAAPVVATAPVPSPAPASPAEPAATTGNVVTSPMVGTAYRRPEPNAAPFVEVGDAVTAGQVVMIVEAMKTMNQIVADVAGTIETIFIEDGQPVEYGEPLLSIA